MNQPSSALGSTRSDSGAGRGAAAQQHAITEADIEEEQEKIASYEAAFREIKEATGVADVNEARHAAAHSRPRPPGSPDPAPL